MTLLYRTPWRIMRRTCPLEGAFLRPLRHRSKDPCVLRHHRQQAAVEGGGLSSLWSSPVRCPSQAAPTLASFKSHGAKRLSLSSFPRVSRKRFASDQEELYMRDLELPSAASSACLNLQYTSVYLLRRSRLRPQSLKKQDLVWASQSFIAAR